MFEFGPFRLDSRSESLSCDGREIHLTAKGYATLLLLVERAGSLVSKDEILASVWPSGFVEPANLTQTIYVLRKSLGDADGRLIETVPSRGYRFTPPVQSSPSSNGATHASAHSNKARTRIFAVALPLVIAALLFAVFGNRLFPPAHAIAAPNPQALRDYILGRHYWNERTIPNIKLGLHYFNAALAIAPTYAAAESGVADSYSALAYYGPYSAQHMQNLNLSRSAALRAIRFDPNSAEAHASLAFVDEFLGRAYRNEVGAEFQRSIALDARYATAREWYSWYLFNHGKLQDAIAQMVQARSLDPLSPVINEALGTQFYFSRRYTEAADQWHLAMTIDPNSENAYYGAGLADEQLRQDQRAEREFQHALTIAPTDPDAMSALAHVYANARDPRSALRWLARFANMKPTPAY
ncbi:MAG TPA: winged helix-turn-helix domain-containing protein, partial [Candidatus Eremiobacteraceae bacterium]|nr:winged helix-turn-helix domain-containing protein [Candidatus Eremiobacteraceae bacterium]